MFFGVCARSPAAAAATSCAARAEKSIWPKLYSEELNENEADLPFAMCCVDCSMDGQQNEVLCFGSILLGSRHRAAHIHCIIVVFVRLCDATQPKSFAMRTLEAHSAQHTNEQYINGI